jgi:hypothetical protein
MTTILSFLHDHRAAFLAASIIVASIAALVSMARGAPDGETILREERDR